MTLYTTMPFELIQGSVWKEPDVQWIDGVRCETVEDLYGNISLSRIESTDLRDYLKPALMPGRVLHRAENRPHGPSEA